MWQWFLNLPSTADAAWTWFLRGLAVYLALEPQVAEPTLGYYVLLIGLFFGPEAIKGQLAINRSPEDDK